MPGNFPGKSQLAYTQNKTNKTTTLSIAVDLYRRKLLSRFGIVRRKDCVVHVEVRGAM